MADIAKERKFRPNAAVILTDGQGKVLLCYRSQRPAGTVQTVQGGIDEGETAEEAAVRELHEEVGLFPEDFEIIAAAKEPMRYEWPPELRLKPGLERYVGQEQFFFLAKVRPEAQFVLDSHHIQEFSEVAWGTPAKMLELSWDMKRPNIERAMREFGLIT